MDSMQHRWSEPVWALVFPNPWVLPHLKVWLTEAKKKIVFKTKTGTRHLHRAGLYRAVGNCTSKKLIMLVPSLSAALKHSWASVMRQWTIAWFTMQLPRFRSEQAQRDNIHYLYLKPVTFDLTRKSNQTSLIPRMDRKGTMSVYK